MIPLYRRLLAERFEDLPAAVRTLHDVVGPSTWAGQADVTRGASVVARTVARLFRLPPAGRSQPLTVTFTPNGGREVWVRDFGGRRFVSTQSACGVLLCERIGPVVLRMTCLAADAGGLALGIAGGRFLGVPLPGFLLPHIETREFDADGRYRFAVEATLPGFGRLVRYEGWLERVAR